MANTIQETFVLPSKGMIYSEKVNPEITLTSMTTEQELKRLSPTETPYKVMADIIEECMVEKPKIHVYDMCLGDYQFLLHKLRIVSFGTQYKVQMRCPNCGELVETIADLDSLEVKEWDENYLNLTRVTLPISGKIIELNYQTPRDLDTIAYKTKERQKKAKSIIDYSLIYTLISLIKTIDGQTYNELALEEFVKKLYIKDTNTIIAVAKKLNEYIGFDNTLLTKCSKCDFETVIPFRITNEFFGPTD